MAIDRTKLSNEDDVHELVTGYFFAAKGGSLTELITAGQMRARLVEHISKYYELPHDRKTADLSDEGVARLIARTRMLEEAKGSVGRDGYKSKYIVGLLTEAAIISLEEGGQPISRSVPSPGSLPKERETRDQEIAVQAKQAETTAGLIQPETAIPLFGEKQSPVRGLPESYLSLLVPGPGPDADLKTIGLWLKGEPLDSMSFSIGFPELDGQAQEAIAELEAEFYASSKSAWKRASCLQCGLVRGPQNASSDIDELRRQFAGDARAPEDLLSWFRDAVALALRVFRPEQEKILSDHAATLRVGKDLLDTISAVMALESEWLQETGGTLDGEEQDLRGSALPERKIDPGLSLKIACCTHIASGMPMDEAIFLGCSEFRRLQAYRIHDGDIIRQIKPFDDLLSQNWLTPISEFGNAKNNMEDAFEVV